MTFETTVVPQRALSEGQRDLVYERLVYSCPMLVGLSVEGDTFRALLDQPDSLDRFHDVFRRVVEVAATQRVSAPVVLKDNVDSSPAASAREATDADARLVPALVRAVDAVFRDEGVRQGAVERHHSALVDLGDLQRCDYVSRFAHTIYGTSAVSHDLDSLEEWRATGDVDATWVVDGKILRPALCFSAYIELADAPLPGDGVHLQTTRGTCFRHEAPWRLSPTRRLSFDMRENVFLGHPEVVEQRRIHFLEHCWTVFESLGLRGRVQSATDPFFFADDREMPRYQVITRAKYELQALTAGYGVVALASFNNVRAGLSTPYGVVSASTGDPVHSGCAAYGLERWAYALLDRHGPDLDAWPAPVIEVLAL